MRSFLAVVILVFGWSGAQGAVLRLTSPQAAGGTLSVSVGDTLTLQLSLDPEGEQIQGLEAFVTLPDSVFQVLDASPTQSGVQPFSPGGLIGGSVFFNRLYTDSQNRMHANQMDYSELRQSGSISASGVVASVRVVALRSGKNLRLSIDNLAPFRVTRYFVPNQDAPVFFRQLVSLSGEVIGFPVSALPSVRVPAGGEDRTVDLDGFASDPDFSDADLAWAASGYDSLLVSVSIDPATHVVTFASVGTKTGTTSVLFTATDPAGKTGSTTDQVSVTVGPKIVGLGNLTVARDSVVQFNLDQYVTDADNTPGQLTWTATGGSHVAAQLSGHVLTLTPEAGWTGVDAVTLRVSDPDQSQDEKTLVVTVAEPDTSSGGGAGGGGGNGGATPPDKTVQAGMVGIWSHATGDTLLYADVGDTLSLDIQANVGSAQANGFELFVAFEGRYLTPLDQSPDAGVQPFVSKGLLPGSSVWINKVLTVSDSVWTHIRYAEVSLGGTATDTGTVAGLQFVVKQPIPAGVSAFVTIENDTLDQRRSSYTVQGIGTAFSLLPRNRIAVRNRPPRLLVPEQLTIAEDGSLNLDLDALVEDSGFTPDQMQWAVTASETGFSVQVQTVDGVQRLSLTPPRDWNGAATLFFQVTDPEGMTVAQSAVLVVTPVNDPPVFSPSLQAGIELDEDQTRTLNLDSLVTDVDNALSDLSWTLKVGKSVAVQLSSGSGLLRILPPADWSGRDTFQLTVSDVAGDSVTARVPVLVRPVNDPPVFTSSLPSLQNVNRDTLVDLRPFVADVDDSLSTLTWQVSGGQHVTAAFESGGLLSLRVPNPWAGTEVLSITVTDPHGASVTASLNVSASLAGDFNGDGKIAFEDFVLFAQHYGAVEGEAGYDPKFDLNGNGTIDFADFVRFAQAYGT